MLTTQFIRARQRESRRLLIALHGLGDSLAGYRWLAGALELEDMNYLLVNAPEEYYGGYSWFEFPGDHRPGVARSAQLLFALLDDCRNRGFASEQTTLFGFSQGCLMTVEVGLRYPHRLAGLIGVSGWVPEPERLLRERSAVAGDQRLLLTHGLYDPLLPMAMVREQVAQLRAGGLRIEWHEFAKEHTIAGEAELAVIRAFITASEGDSTQNRTA